MEFFHTFLNVERCVRFQTSRLLREGSERPANDETISVKLPSGVPVPSSSNESELPYLNPTMFFLYFPVLMFLYLNQQQLRLDVSEFGKEAARLGVDVSPFPPYERLLEVVEAGGEGASINTAAR